jgi:hypothetical protein
MSEDLPNPTVVNVGEAPDAGGGPAPWSAHWKEVCGYPDSGKLLVRPARAIGAFEPREYMHGEPTDPPVFRLWSDAASEDP